MTTSRFPTIQQTLSLHTWMIFNFNGSIDCFDIISLAQKMNHVVESGKTSTKKLSRTDYSLARKVYGCLHEEFDATEKLVSSVVTAIFTTCT